MLPTVSAFSGPLLAGRNLTKCLTDAKKVSFFQAGPHLIISDYWLILYQGFSQECKPFLRSPVPIHPGRPHRPCLAWPRPPRPEPGSYTKLRSLRKSRLLSLVVKMSHRRQRLRQDEVWTAEGGCPTSGFRRGLPL